MKDDCLLISDIHGCWFTLTRLLNKAPRGVKLVFLGDLIDRGPHSRLVVEFAMGHSIPTVRANHDDLCLDFYRRGKCHDYYDRQVWLSNGGDAAAANWPTIDRRDIHWRRDEYAGGRVPDSVLDWFESLPPYLTPSDELDENGRKLLCSHTGYGLDGDKGNWYMALWGRHAHGEGEFPDDGYHRCFGHTPSRDVQHGEGWSMIDTGAAYGKRGYGKLSGLLWPSKRIIEQVYDETPADPTFSISQGLVVDRVP